VVIIGDSIVKHKIHYAWFPPFRCRSAVGGQPISVLVTSSLCIRKDGSSISVLTRNGNCSYGTEERQRNGGNQVLQVVVMEFITRHVTLNRHNGVLPAPTCYGETGVMNFGL